MVNQHGRSLDDRQVRLIFGMILFLAVVIRVAVAFYYGDWLPDAQDDHSYSELGLRLANGYGFTFGQDWYPFTPADTPTAHWSFLYTAYTAVIYTVAGFHPVVIRVVGAVLSGLLLPWIMFRFVRRLFPHCQRLPLVAAAISAIYAYFILFAARIMTESFFIIALVWSFERALVLKEKMKADNWRPEIGTFSVAITLGVSLGIAALLRQSVLPWAAILLVWLFFDLAMVVRSNFQRLVRTVPLLVSTLVILAFILPFTVRNYFVYGELLLLNSNAGYAMYSAQHPMHGINFKAFTAAPLPEEIPLHSLNEAQWDQELMARGIGFILAEPDRYILLSASRLMDYFEFWPTGTSFLHNFGRLISFTLFLPFFVSGIWMFILRSRFEGQSWRAFWRQPAAVGLLFILFYSLLHIFTWAMPRYRLPVDAVAIPFASLAILELWSVFRGNRFIQFDVFKQS